MKRVVFALLVVAVCLPSAHGGDVVLVDEDFESYADDTALFMDWVPGASNVGLVDETLYPDAFPVPGQGVEHTGGVVIQWAGLNAGNAVGPSETQSLVVRGDVFDDGLGNTANKRMTIGLWGLASSGSKLLELGLYNSNSCDPTVCAPGDPPEATFGAAPQNADMTTPGFYVGTGYGYRMQLFGAFDEPLNLEPDWQYFQLPIELDRQPAGGAAGDYNQNGVVDAADYTRWRDQLGQAVTLPNEGAGTSPGMVDDEDYTVWNQNFGNTGTAPNGRIDEFDVGPGWHRYQATIRPDSITVEIDLYRDGLRNTSRIPDPISGIRPGTPGVDASVTWPVISNGTFDNLRFGGPSNLSSAGGALVFDNIFLALVDAPAESGSFGAGVPEPATAWLAIFGMGALAFRRQAR